MPTSIFSLDTAGTNQNIGYIVAGLVVGVNLGLILIATGVYRGARPFGIFMRHRAFFLLWIVPVLLTYLLLHTGQLGYVLMLLPPVFLLIGTTLSGMCEGRPAMSLRAAAAGGGRLLARSDGAFPNQAMIFGPAAVGIQFHPEITYTQVNRWSGSNPTRLLMRGARPRPDHLAGHLTHGPIVRQWLDQFLSRWVKAALVAAARGNWVQVGLPPNPNWGYLGQQLGSGPAATQHALLIDGELINGGKLRWNRAVAEQELVKAEQELYAQQQRVVTDVRVAFFDARAIIASEASIPCTTPLAPTRRFAAIASVPVPQPTSSTASPDRSWARSINRSRNTRSRPSMKTQASRSYRAAQ